MALYGRVRCCGALSRGHIGRGTIHDRVLRTLKSADYRRDVRKLNCSSTIVTVKRQLPAMWEIDALCSFLVLHKLPLFAVSKVSGWFGSILLGGSSDFITPCDWAYDVLSYPKSGELRAPYLWFQAQLK